jgi:hypothetical protein
MIYFQSVENEGNILGGRCVIAVPGEIGTSPLFDPRGFTPKELRRMANVQARQRNEIHVLIQLEDGVEEKVVNFEDARIGKRELRTAVVIAEELMEVSNGFYFENRR